MLSQCGQMGFSMITRVMFGSPEKSCGFFSSLLRPAIGNMAPHFLHFRGINEHY